MVMLRLCHEEVEEEGEEEAREERLGCTLTGNSWSFTGWPRFLGYELGPLLPTDLSKPVSPSQPSFSVFFFLPAARSMRLVL